MDILDCIHCYFIHSIDGGFRCLQQIGNNISSLKSYLENKKNNLKNIIGDIRFKNNKFVTQIMPQTDMEEIEEKEDNVISLRDGFGAKFDYHGDDTIHKAKYKNLKKELIQNKIYAINISAFDKAYQKALYLLNHSTIVRLIKSAKFNFNHPAYRYLIDGNISLEISNILSIILYSDFDILSYHFKETFKKTSMIQSYNKLLIKNCEFFNWSKKLIETVNCYGNTVKHTKIHTYIPT
eukprot:447981_1